MSSERQDVPVRRRPYRQTARARTAAATRRRILDAGAARVRAERPTPLEAIARDAGTTVPTVLRHFGTRDALVAAAVAEALAGVRAARPRVAPGQHRAAARVLGAEYEREAGLLRAASLLDPDAQRGLEAATRLHRDWLARTFAGALSPLPPVIHRRRLAQLVAVSGPGPWRVLRDTEHLGVDQATAALAELLHALAP